MTTKRPTRNDLPVALTSDGTPAGTAVHVRGRRLRNVQAVDLHVDADGVRCTVTIGETAIDYGPADVEITDAAGNLRPGPTPRRPR